VDSGRNITYSNRSKTSLWTESVFLSQVPQMVYILLLSRFKSSGLCHFSFPELGTGSIDWAQQTRVLPNNGHRVQILVLLCLTIIFFLLHVGSPLWREDGSVVCSAINQWPESRRTRIHTLVSHLRLPQLGRPCPRVYIPRDQGSPFIPPVTRLPFCRLLRLAGLRWRYLFSYYMTRTANKTESIILLSVVNVYFVSLTP
jgi:hypothetical protein